MLQQSSQALRVSARNQAEGIVVEVVGEVHSPNVERFLESLQAVIREQTGTVLLDFRQVGFIDSAGLKAVLDTRKQLSLQSRPLCLRLTAGSQPDRVAHTSRIDTVIPLRYE